jgi:hypothetical protein
MGATDTKESLTFRKSKDNTYKTQEKMVYDYLLFNVVSATMVTHATGVVQKNVTRFKRKFEALGLLAEVKNSKCKITGRVVAYITTNPALFPKQTQLTLFNL